MVKKGLMQSDIISMGRNYWEVLEIGSYGHDLQQLSCWNQ